MEYIKERVGAYVGRTGTTKREIAEALGIGENTLYAKLRGESEFTLSEAGKLADMLGCSIDSLTKPLT